MSWLFSLCNLRKLSGLEDMPKQKRNQPTGRGVKNDGQLMLGLGCPHQPQCLPEPDRSQCISLLVRMLLCAINHKSEPKNHTQP